MKNDATTRDRLVREGMPLLSQEVGRAFRRRGMKARNRHADEFRSDMALGLLLAAESYDPARGSFAPYAVYRMRATATDFLRARTGHRRRGEAGEASRRLVAALSMSVRKRSGLLNRADRRTPDPSAALAEREAFEAVARHAPTRAHRLVLRLVYVGGLNYEEAASAIGVVATRVSQLHGEAVAAIREAASGAGCGPRQ